MDGHSRSSHKYLLLQVWCGLLTVAMVVMAALLTSIKPKSTEVSHLPQDEEITFRFTFTALCVIYYLTSKGSSLSYIQLIRSPDNRSWQNSARCHSCSLDLRDGSIYCTESSLYFIYAQVTFSKHPMNRKAKSVILRRNATFGRSMKKLVEGTFPQTTAGSVWVGKIVSLTEGDSVSLDITDDFLTDNTFWGAYQLR
ncbi:LOW QUALITY PROTEIN: lymphotoxin-alpha [Enoplosus armatus]|uniref:LOW QUALITY PROTEIN: lymphotoxin-alpha n=1 Tax=Enoplosus armatus TaxID=215367 RepID=UPI0039915323